MIEEEWLYKINIQDQNWMFLIWLIHPNPRTEKCDFSPEMQCTSHLYTSSSIKKSVLKRLQSVIS